MNEQYEQKKHHRYKNIHRKDVILKYRRQNSRKRRSKFLISNNSTNKVINLLNKNKRIYLI